MRTDDEWYRYLGWTVKTLFEREGFDLGLAPALRVTAIRPGGIAGARVRLQPATIGRRAWLHLASFARGTRRRGLTAAPNPKRD